ALLLACAYTDAPANGPPPISVTDSCPFARDGVCDEPTNCALGTDSTDCEAVCASGEAPHLFGAACAHRQPAEPAEAPAGTGGSLHETGWRDGTLEVPSGLDANRTVQRHFRLYVPTSYRPDRASPLVVVLPGHRVDIYGQADYTQLVRTAELNRFLVVFAEQEFRQGRWAWWTDWQWATATRENPDLLFLRRLVERTFADYNVDRGRVFAAGHSRGASMAIIAALELGDLFAGACAQSGFTEFGYHQRIERWTGRKVPLVLIHGMRDDDVCVDCTAGGSCRLITPQRRCGDIEASDALFALFKARGWTTENLVYYRLEHVTHRWQPQLNQQWFDFLHARPMEAR
ncbi:MAG: alpha/beta hydrolase family esterase, partial [Myxococcales bacterium]